MSLQPGDVVFDPHQPDPDPAVVVNTLGDKSIEDWTVYGHGFTVAEDNPEYPSHSQAVCVVYLPELHPEYRFYTGIAPLRLELLHETNTTFYTYPEPRLYRAGKITSVPVAVDEIQPSPYSQREFHRSDNDWYVRRTRRNDGPTGPLLLHATTSGQLTVIDGHKRLWGCKQADVSVVEARCLYVPPRNARNAYLNRHLDDDTPRDAYLEDHDADGYPPVIPDDTEPVEAAGGAA